VKELESQLLIERKLARQHVDTKIAEQQQHQQLQQKQQQDELNYAVTKPPLPILQPLGIQKTLSAAPLGKDIVNLIRPLTENNSILRPPTTPPLFDNHLKYNKTAEKENKPEREIKPEKENRFEIAEIIQHIPKRTGRVSICTAAPRRIPVVTAPRRNSLMPLPTTSSNLVPTPPLLMVPPPQVEKRKETTEANESETSEQENWSLKGQKVGNKKFNSILRRSLQKKVSIKSSPLQQHMRKGGTEKSRLTIVGKGRTAQRFLLNNGVPKEVPQKHKEKERGWNL
ncbi:hypothetical protein MKW94_017279, partial [Papaver nudicaule]|nr:hypothetical protein [Papaver nudicaule]